jgi:NTP pyrophosphatase (non-canonical NTP hydrolase)
MKKHPALAKAVTQDLERASVRRSISKKTLAVRIAAKIHLSATHVNNMLAGNNVPTNPANRRRILSAIREELELMFAENGVDGEPTDYVAQFSDAQQLPLDATDASAQGEPPATLPLRVIFSVSETVDLLVNYTDATMNEWQRAFWEVYGLQDNDLKLHDMMLQLTVDATRLSEAVRKENFVEALSVLPRLLSWLFSLNSKTVGSYPDLSPKGALLADVVWHKYPRRCSLCAQRSCICVTWVTDDLTSEERIEKERENEATLAAARKDESQPRTLDEWVEMFEEIYGRVNRSRSASDKMLHLWEEIGELEVELRNADRRAAGQPDAKATDWESELADVFSWVSSVYLHITGYLRRAQFFHDTIEAKSRRDAPSPSAFPQPPQLSRWVWLEFRGDRDNGGLRCHKCGYAVCGCTINYRRR